MKSIKKLSSKRKSKNNSRNSTNSISNGDVDKNTFDQNFDQKQDQDDKSEKSPNHFVVEQQICALCGKLTSNFVKAYLIRKSYYRCA